MNRAASTAFAPELAYLLALVRTALGRPETAAAPADLHWPRFLALVERHRVGALLHQRAAATLAAHCPPAVAAQLQAAAAGTLRRALAQTAEVGRLHDALAAAGVPVATVKGLALAHQLHGGPGLRFAGDLDLVVAPEDVARADTVLQAAGLRRTRPDFPLTPRQHREYLRVKPEFEYVRAHPPQRVELLWQLEGLHRAPAWAPLALGGRPLRTLALPDHACYLLQHGARHAWFRLFWLVDIALLLERPGLDWAALLAEARAAGTDRAVWQGVALAVELLGAPRPAALAGPSPEPAVLAALVAEARRQLTRTPPPHEAFGEWARQLHYRTRLVRSGRAKLAVLAPHLFTPSNWAVWRLPDRWFFLYYPATPFLWLWRYLRRRRPDGTA